MRKTAWVVWVFLFAAGCEARLSRTDSRVNDDSPGPVASKEPASESPTQDVEQRLTTARWLSTSGMSEGLKWRFVSGGKVLIYSEDGDVDEEYQWEILSRNESTRTLKIKYMKASGSASDYREWHWTFSEDGKSAVIENYRRKDGTIEFRGDMNMQSVP